MSEFLTSLDPTFFQGPQFLDRLVDVSALVGLEDMATLAGSRQAFFPRGLGPK